LTTIKAGRDQTALDNSLSALKTAAQDHDLNLFPFILAAVREYASIGEISNTLRSVFGEYQS
jgi:methylmalonyl-CoA mutase N-terminal domain/subunit